MLEGRRGTGEIVKFCALASGSSGNAALVATENTRVLLDAGLSMRELSRRLAAIGEDLSRLDAILVTHEHSDHVAGLPVIARSGRCPAVMYFTGLTKPTIDWGGATPAIETFQAGTAFRIGDIDVQSFSIPHDAVDPVGYCFEAEGIRIGVATDLGYVPDSVKYHLRRTDLLLFEANHDPDMLKVGPYPWAVKQRVLSRVGHLSNLAMADFLMDGMDASTYSLILGHISEQNNHPELVRMSAADALATRRLAPQLTLATQRAATEVFRF
jgi:phosphoribosyl 1,2-cyclic phosphodiesterase